MNLNSRYFAYTLLLSGLTAAVASIAGAAVWYSFVNGIAAGLYFFWGDRAARL